MLPEKFSVVLLAPLLRHLGANQKTVSLRKDETIFSHGARSNSMFYIEKGIVKLTVTSPKGKEAFIGLLGEGHLFGESCLLSGMRIRIHTATAMTELQLLKLDGSAIRRVLHTNAELAYAFILYLLSRSAAIETDLASNLLDSTEQRLKRVLSYLRLLGQPENAGNLHNFTQQELGSIIGASRQRVNILMKRLRQ
jgi:CRP-like cAMP-binding protein